MRPPKHLTIALTLALLSLLVAGCGGGGGNSTAQSTEKEEAKPALTKQELISQGDSICAEVNTAVGSVGTSAASTESQIIQTANLYIGMVESLKRLGAPQEKAGYSEFLAAAEGLAKIEGEIKLSAEREDTTAIGEQATEAAPILEEFQAASAQYGFEQCGEGPHAPTTTGPGTGVTPPAEEAEGGLEAAPEEEYVPEEEAAPEEEYVPETGGAGGAGGEEAAPETGGGEAGGTAGGIGPG
jgi:hypothetical protein